jgi:Retroviral aspartyl protease
VTPTLHGLLQDPLNPKQSQKIKLLFDSGASRSIVKNSIIPKSMLHREQQSITWTTVAGKFETYYTTIVNLKLPILHESRVIRSQMHVAAGMGKYDVIIGRDLLQALGITLNFKDNVIEWGNGIVPMPSTDTDSDDIVHLDSESKAVRDATNRVKHIIEAKYEKADLSQIVSSCSQLSTLEQHKLLKLLQLHEPLFDGTLGHWKGQPYDIKLRDGIKPYHARPYPIPKVYEATLKMEVDRLC